MKSTKLTGLNYSAREASGKYRHNGGTQIVHTDNDTRSNVSGENFLTTGNTFNRSESANRSRQTEFSTNNTLRFRSKTIAEHKVYSDIRLNNWKNGTDAAQATFDSNPFGYGTAAISTRRSTKATTTG